MKAPQAGIDSTWDTNANGGAVIDITDNEHILCVYTFEASGGVITITKDAPAANGENFDFEISGTGTACDDTFILEDGESAAYGCGIDGTYIVTESDLPTGWELTGISCTDIDINSSDITIDEANASVQVMFRDNGESLDCTFTNAPVATATPTATGTATATTTASPTKTPATATATPGSVTPPNTGDAGLADGGGMGSGIVYVLALFAAAIPFGYMLLNSRRTRKDR